MELPVFRKTSDITSYDLLKSVAVVTMIIDHIGYYMLPEEMMLRAFGRISFPIWFFLIGHARSRDIGPRLIGGAVVIALADAAIGVGLVPLNVLFTIILIRLVRERLMAFTLATGLRAFAVPVVMLILTYPSFSVFEYGFQGFLVAMFGYVVRNRPAVPGMSEPDRLVTVYLLMVLLSYVFQQAIFGFSAGEALTMMSLAIATSGILFYFRPETYPGLSKRCPVPLKVSIQLMGRRTLEIYVGHLLLFKAWGLVYRPGRFTLFDWQWTQIGF